MGAIDKPLSIMFERSWRTAKVPENWRKANVTPAIKKGKKNDSGIHRPVSPTFTPRKVMEQLNPHVITKYVEEKNAIRSSQHGFTKEKSCLTYLVSLL